MCNRYCSLINSQPNKACTRRWGFLARFQAFFYVSAFFQSDGVPPPAPARVSPKGDDVANR